MRPALPRTSSRTIQVGSAPFFTGAAEVDAYAARINLAIRSLSDDVGEQIVLKPTEEVVKAGGDILLDAVKKIYGMKTTPKSSTPAEDIAFASDYYAFAQEWRATLNEFNTTLPDALPPGVAGNSYADRWEIIEGYESRFRQFYRRFEALGYRASAPLPLTQKQIEDEHPTGGLNNVFNLNVPWVPILGVATVIGVGVVGYSYYASKKGSSK